MICDQILSVFNDNLDTSDPNDPEVIIKVDICNAFNTACRVTKKYCMSCFDTLTGTDRFTLRRVKRGGSRGPYKC